MDGGSNKALFTLLAVVIFGIFLSMSYWLFEGEFKLILSNVMDSDSQSTDVKLSTLFNSEVQPTPANYFIFEPSTGTITGYLDAGPKDVIIPTEIDGVTVTALGNYAFRTKLLTSVTIPNTVKTIGYYAFEFNYLTSVIIPDSVTLIEPGAFRVNQLTNLTLSNSLLFIGYNAFETNQLTTVLIPSSALSIDSSTFASNPLTSASVPSSTYIYAMAFPTPTVITKY